MTIGVAYRRDRHGQRLSEDDRAWIVDQYTNHYKTMDQIHAARGYCRNTIRRALRKAGVQARSVGQYRWWHVRENHEHLVALYNDCDRDMRELAKMLDANEDTLNAAFTRYKLPRRSRKESGRVRGERMRKGTGQRAHIRSEIQNRVRSRCAFPGCSNDDLQIHHLNGDRSDSREANLVALCTAHHMVVEFFVRKATHRYERSAP